MTLRVLAVTLRYPPYVAGGYELLTRDAVEALRARGHDVRVLAGRGRRLAGDAHVLPWLEPDLDGDPDLFRRSFEGSNAERFRLHFLSPANLAAARRALREVRPDVVLAFNLGLVSLAPLLAARLAGVPTLTYASDPWPANHWLEAWRRDAERERGSAGTKRARLAALARFWSVFRDLVDLGPMLACSADLRRRLVASGIAGETIDVLHLAVPPDMAALAARAETPPAHERGPLRVVCLSSFWEGKGQDVLLEATAEARRRGVELEVEFVGAGGGGYLDALARRAAAPDLAGAVRLRAGLDREGVSRALARAHAFVLPSTWGEPFPLATLEALVHGVPVVVSDAGGSPEAIVDGEHGLVVPAGDAGALADALARLARDEPLRRALAEAGARRAREELAHAAFVDRLERELRRLAGSAAPEVAGG